MNVHQQPAARELCQAIQELWLGQILFAKLSVVDVILKQEGNWNRAPDLPYATSDHLQYVSVVGNRNREPGIVIKAIWAADLNKGEMIAVPGKMILLVNAGDVIQIGI